MRIAALAGLLAFATIAVSSATASAEALDLLQVNQQLNQPGAVLAKPSVLASFTPPITPVAPPQQTKPEPVKYTVAENDTLTMIAERHSTTWKRLYDKNESVQDPDVLKIGDVLTIPGADEQLKERSLPESPELPVANVQPQSAPKRSAPAASQAVRPRGSSGGNLYTPGYCTWYVKNKRPDLPNNLGNADTWVARARAQGMPTGSAPRAGAVGQRGMHVVYVESVNPDGSVNISEMNHKGLYVITRRTLPGSYFMYIY